MLINYHSMSPDGKGTVMRHANTDGCGGLFAGSPADAGSNLTVRYELDREKSRVAANKSAPSYSPPQVGSASSDGSQPAKESVIFNIYVGLFVIAGAVAGAINGYMAAGWLGACGGALAGTLAGAVASAVLLIAVGLGLIAGMVWLAVLLVQAALSII